MIKNEVLSKLNSLDSKIIASIEKSKFEEDLEIFKTIQVHTGCGGCFGTQISCVLIC